MIDYIIGLLMGSLQISGKRQLKLQQRLAKAAFADWAFQPAKAGLVRVADKKIPS